MTQRQHAVIVGTCVVCFGAGMLAQSVTDVASYQASPSGTRLDVLFDGPTMGVEVDVAQLTFPPGTNSGDHSHGVTEIFYVLEGTLEHVVNGESHILTEGMLGYVKPPDMVNHIVDVDGAPARTLVIWAPGGEAARLASGWEPIP
ncbi:MAG: cupin domain-containing protein [Acidobacteriota bacterium]|nr:cupin domain-containing protein [Acidobacteriota bacterium]